MMCRRTAYLTLESRQKKPQLFRAAGSVEAMAREGGRRRRKKMHDQADFKEAYDVVKYAK